MLCKGAGSNGDQKDEIDVVPYVYFVLVPSLAFLEKG